MRVMLVHNYYQQPGGEDIVFESEAKLLESRGHVVRREAFRNTDIEASRSALDSARLAVSTVWSRAAARRIRDAVREFRPDVAHFHNTFPLVSPAAYAACQEAGVPVVQTLHNYRLLCASANQYRDGGVCEDCTGRRLAWPAVLHACYRGSRPMSATIAATQKAHQFLRRLGKGPDLYIALSEQNRRLFESAGLEGEVAVKPNFVAPDPGVGSHDGGFALFVGRLSPEKGIATLLEAWRLLSRAVPLKLIGNGPMAQAVEWASRGMPSIQWLGARPYTETVELMGQASLLVFPSEWQEPFGRTIIEAYARGTPVLASDIGASRELVQPAVSGDLFRAGDAGHLAARVEALTAQPAALRAMGLRGRRLYELHYTAEANYEQLMQIYGRIVARRGRASSPAGVFSPS